MLRQIIKINEDLCTGCGLCVTACHEGAIGLVDGKAKLLRDDYCDGLGNCLPACPTGAISFEQREAAEYNEEEVKKNMELKKTEAAQVKPHAEGLTPEKMREENMAAVKNLACGCPGTAARAINREAAACPSAEKSRDFDAGESELRQWPVQIKLVNPHASYLQGARLLIAADCTAYAYARFHRDFIKSHITLIGCPKLDAGDYAEKLTEILKTNDIKSLKVVRMEVPCCGGIASAAIAALKASGKMIPWQVVTISTDGRILED